MENRQKVENNDEKKLPKIGLRHKEKELKEREKEDKKSSEYGQDT